MWLCMPYWTLMKSYLGLPANVGRSRMPVFNNLKDKFWNWINAWREKCLSNAGNEVLIKSIVQPIPTFVTSYFKLPLELCKDLTGMMNSFWCGQKADERRILWVGWSKICYHIVKSKVECDFRICYHIRSKATAFLTHYKKDCY